MCKMNNKGFAVTTIIYSVVLLLSLVIMSILTVLKSEYDNQKTYINDINEELTECLTNKDC